MTYPVVSECPQLSQDGNWWFNGYSWTPADQYSFADPTRPPVRRPHLGFQVGRWWHPWRSNTIKAVLLKWSILWCVLFVLVVNLIVRMHWFTQNDGGGPNVTAQGTTFHDVDGNTYFQPGPNLIDVNDTGNFSGADMAPVVQLAVAWLIVTLIWAYNVLMCSIAVRHPDGARKARIFFWVTSAAVLAERGHQRKEYEHHVADQRRQADLIAKATVEQQRQAWDRAHPIWEHAGNPYGTRRIS